MESKWESFSTQKEKFTAALLGGVPKRAHFLLSPTHKWILKQIFLPIDYLEF